MVRCWCNDGMAELEALADTMTQTSTGVQSRNDTSGAEMS
jgi:hypothetical protein